MSKGRRNGRNGSPSDCSLVSLVSPASLNDRSVTVTAVERCSFPFSHFCPRFSLPKFRPQHCKLLVGRAERPGPAARHAHEPALRPKPDVLEEMDPSIV